MEGKDEPKQQEQEVPSDSPNSTEEEGQQMNEFLNMPDKKKSEGKVVVDRAVLHRKVLEQRRSETLEKLKLQKVPTSDAEDDSNWVRPKPDPPTTWRSSWDSKIDEHFLAERAARRKKLDEERMKAEMEERARKEAEERELEALRLKQLVVEGTERSMQEQRPKEDEEIQEKMHKTMPQELKTEGKDMKKLILRKWKAKQQVKKLGKIKGVSKTRRVSTTDVNPKDMFGYLSVQKYSKEHILKSQSSTNFKSDTDLQEEDNEKDMSWLLLSSNEADRKKSSANFNINKTNEVSTKTSSWLFWLFLQIGGRMPFYFAVENNSGQARPEIICQVKKNHRNYIAFVITSLILIFLTVISCFNLAFIIAKDENTKDPHIQIEKLLLGKNRASALIFLSSLLVASISSINVLIYGDSIAEYMTLCRNSFQDINFDATSGITVVIIIYIIWFSSTFLLELIIFLLTKSYSEPSPFIEEIHLLTAIVFQFFVPKILLTDLEHPLEIPQLEKYGAFIICLRAYAMYCSVNFIIMVMLCAIGIRNFAKEWNFRLGVILREINARKNELSLQSVRRSLGYEKMFDWHRNVVLLVKKNSTIFCTILFAFYMSVAFVLAGVLLDIAIFTVGQEKVTFNLNETSHIYDLEKNTNHLLLLCFHFSQALGIFLFVSYFLAETSSVVMDASGDLTRLNYVNATSTHQRKFFMSLSMSFSGKKPYLLGAGSIFSIDRPFILGFLAVLLYFFSVMIQTQHPRLLNLPILIEYPPGSGQFQVVWSLENTADDVHRINDENAGAAKTYVESLHQTTSTIRLGARFTRSTTTPSTSSKPNPINFDCDCSKGIRNQLVKCPGVELNRYCVYDANQVPIKSFSNTLECIYNPYPASKGPYFDCFNHQLRLKDDCGNLNFGSHAGLPIRTDVVDVPKLVSSNRSDLISTFSVNCYDKKEYIPLPLDLNYFKWYACGMIHWLAETVCIHLSPSWMDDPTALTQENFQKKTAENFQSKLNTSKLCGPDAPKLGPLGSPVLFEHVVTSGGGQFLLAYPNNTIPPARQYFPHFHPKLLGKFLDKPTLQFCNAGVIREIKLIHDDCGFLDFEGSGTPKYKAGRYNCYNQHFCDPTICAQWEDWYNHPENQPILP